MFAGMIILSEFYGLNNLYDFCLDLVKQAILVWLLSSLTEMRRRQAGDG